MTTTTSLSARDAADRAAKALKEAEDSVTTSNWPAANQWLEIAKQWTTLAGTIRNFD
jgi:hypothetical protein